MQEVHEPVALAVLRIHEVGHRADHLARRCPDDFNGIIETTASKGLELRAVGPHPPDARGEALQIRALFRFDVEAMPAIGEVEPAVRPEERAVQARRAAHIPAAQQHRA